MGRSARPSSSEVAARSWLTTPTSSDAMSRRCCRPRPTPGADLMVGGNEPGRRRSNARASPSCRPAPRRRTPGGEARRRDGSPAASSRRALSRMHDARPSSAECRRSRRARARDSACSSTSGSTPSSPTTRSTARSSSVPSSAARARRARSVSALARATHREHRRRWRPRSRRHTDADRRAATARAPRCPALADEHVGGGEDVPSNVGDDRAARGQHRRRCTPSST